MEIAPPNPVFISPPSQIIRTVLEDERAVEANLLPDRQTLEVLIEFPDGHERPLARTVLYVNGVPAVENTEPPFDRFIWDLSAHTTSGRHTLRVETEDSLGLVGTSIETPVQITVQLPRQNVMTVISRNGPILAVLATLLAGAILLLVLVLGGRIRPRPVYIPKFRRKKTEDPVTQPIPARRPTQPSRSQRRLATWANELPGRLQWPQSKSKERPVAFLARFSNDEQPNAARGTAIPITKPEITLGSDPQQATIVLNDPSVEALHGRLRLASDGNFYVADTGSVAGTWINYAPVPKDWTRIEDGDLIHVGRVGFRFTVNPASQPQPPEIIFEEPSR